MPTTRVYQSTDAGAPTLAALPAQQDAGSMMDLLYQCLVTGYGAHAGAGWTRPFKDATQAVFKQGAGSGEYLYLNDVYANMPEFIGYETMSAISTGTGPYPLTGFLNFAYQTGVGVARAWTVIADDRTFYFYHRNTTTSNYSALSFGDGYSYQSSGLYRTYLIVAGYKRVSALTDAGLDYWLTPRDHLGNLYAVSTALALMGDTAKGSSTLLTGIVPYPHGPDDKIWLAPLEIVDHATPAIRMRVRGMWHWLHDTAAVADGDVFPGVGDFAGKNFMIIRNVSDGVAFTGVVVHETSSTWDTN